MFPRITLKNKWNEYCQLTETIAKPNPVRAWINADKPIPAEMRNRGPKIKSLTICNTDSFDSLVSPPPVTVDNSTIRPMTAENPANARAHSGPGGDGGGGGGVGGGVGSGASEFRFGA